MTVSGFDNRKEAERRAFYYRARGYRVDVVEIRSERAGSYVFLRCEPMEGR